MRKYGFFMIFAVALAAAAVAKGEITWINKVHDFGAFDEDTKKKTAWFRFVNTSPEPVSIISATATCGCTVPRYSDQAVAPGDTAVIEVSYDPSGRPGRFEKQVYVRTSDGYDRTKLLIKGTVIGNPQTIGARYPVSMGALKLTNGAAMFGKAYSGHAKMHYVDGYNMSGSPITPVVASAPEWIDVKFTPATVGPGEMVGLDMYFRGEKCDQWGFVTDSVMIAPSAGEQAYSLPVIVIVEEDFSGLSPEQMRDAPVASCSTDRIVLDPVPQGATNAVSASFGIANNGRSPLLVHRVYSQDDGVTVTSAPVRVDAGQSADVRISIDPSVQPTGIINTRVNVITNDPLNPVQTVRVVAERD